MGITAHLVGCRISWSAAGWCIPPGLLSGHEVGGVVAVLPLPLISMVEKDRWAENRRLLGEERRLGRRGKVLTVLLPWVPVLRPRGALVLRAGSSCIVARGRRSSKSAGLCWSGLGSEST